LCVILRNKAVALSLSRFNNSDTNSVNSGFGEFQLYKLYSTKADRDSDINNNIITGHVNSTRLWF